MLIRIGEYALHVGTLWIIGERRHSLPFGEVHVFASSIDRSVFDFRGTSFWIIIMLGTIFHGCYCSSKKKNVAFFFFFVNMHFFFCVNWCSIF